MKLQTAPLHKSAQKSVRSGISSEPYSVQPVISTKDQSSGNNRIGDEMTVQTLSKLIAMAGVFGALSIASSASAQVVSCPPGYGYSYGAGCVPVAPGYAAVYAPPPRAYEPPVYDPLVIAFGGGGGHGHGRGHFDHGHGHFDHR
jgi:hypothetical protein